MGPGDLYRFHLDGGEPLPDQAARAWAEGFRALGESLGMRIE